MDEMNIPTTDDRGKDMTSEMAVSLVISGGVAIVTLNRPDQMNSINVPLAHALMLVMQKLEGAQNVRCVLLRGAGNLFCAGGDLATFLECRETAELYVKEVVTYFHEAISVISRIQVPVVAAVHGSAAGAGFALACACDLVIAADNAKFLMAYTKAGLTPDGSSTWSLPRLIGLRRALELTLLNRVLNAEEALEWGLVTQVVSEEELFAEADRVCKKLAQGPTAALGRAKKLLRDSINVPLETQMINEGVAVSSSMMTADGIEGMNAFLEKRKPNFIGQ